MNIPAWLVIDISDNIIPRAVETSADRLEQTGGLYLSLDRGS